MNTISHLGSQGPLLTLAFDRIVAFVKSTHDSAARSRAESDPRGFLAEQGFNLPSELDVRIVADTRETFHFVLPPDPNIALSDEALSAVAGGKSAASSDGYPTLGTPGTPSPIWTDRPH